MTGAGTRLRLRCTLSGIDGLVPVRVERDDAPELVGSGPDARGFPRVTGPEELDLSDRDVHFDTLSTTYPDRQSVAGLRRT